MKRPNFLYFMTDQHRADWLGCYGHKVLKTPHIDSIAAQGVRFDRFHVAAPVCMPNRASFMTGRMPSVHGLRYNGCFLPLNARTFVDVLRAEGYHTAAFGKTHLQPMLDTPPWRQDGNFNSIIPEAWRDYEYDELYQEETNTARLVGGSKLKTPYYGFDQAEITTLHGDKCGGDYQAWFRQNATRWEELYDLRNELPHNYTCPQAYRTPIPENLYPTYWIADRAIDYLKGRTESTRPFFAFISFPDPHHPFNPPGKYWSLYDPDDFGVDLPYSAHRNPTPPMQWLEQSYHEGGKQMTKQTAFMADDRTICEAKALTAGMIGCIDDAVGRVLAALKQSGLFENTVICFNSDHGDYLGDFNLMLKGLMPFRAVTNIPMIWSDPEARTPKESRNLISTIDISATILERAGLDPYFGMQGTSFLNTIFNGTPSRNELLIEFNDGAPKFGFESPARVRSLVTDEWRYSIYANQTWGELYDLKSDPKETHNLWDEASCSQHRAYLAERLNHHLTNQMDESPRPTRLA